jgi:hypothetical protein
MKRLHRQEGEGTARLGRLGRRGHLLLFLAAGCAVFGIASAVQADIPDGGVVHGCYKTVGGAVRVIDTDQRGRCLPSETALDWNRTGPTGAHGSTGARGATGATGPTGASGGFTGWQFVTNTIVVHDQEWLPLGIACPAGKKVLGGGVTTNSIVSGVGMRVAESGPALQADGWEAKVANEGGLGDVDVTIWAICATVA